MILSEQILLLVQLIVMTRMLRKLKDLWTQKMQVRAILSRNVNTSSTNIQDVANCEVYIMNV